MAFNGIPRMAAELEADDSDFPRRRYRGPLQIHLEPGEISGAEAGRDSATTGAFVQIFVYGYFRFIRQNSLYPWPTVRPPGLRTAFREGTD